MRIRKTVWLPGLFAVLALVLVACGGSEATATPLPTQAVSPTATPSSTADGAEQDSGRLTREEREFLAQVGQAEAASGLIFQKFGVIFDQTYPLRATLIAALIEAGIGTPYIEKLKTLESLDPPDRFKDDHLIWVEAVRELLRIDTEAAAAVRDGDVARFAILNGALGGVNASARIALSLDYCRWATTAPEQLALCTPDDLDLDSDYEGPVNELLRGFMPAFAAVSASIVFPLSLTPEELSKVVAETANNARNDFQEVALDLDGIVPPDELAADHARLRSYFERSIDVISEVDRLGGEGDYQGARGELQRLKIVFCDAREGFESKDFKTAVAIFFTGEQRTCGGASF